MEPIEKDDHFIPDGMNAFERNVKASGHQACMNEHLPTANQIRDMHSVSRIC